MESACFEGMGCGERHPATHRENIERKAFGEMVVEPHKVGEAADDGELGLAKAGPRGLSEPGTQSHLHVDRIAHIGVEEAIACGQGRRGALLIVFGDDTCTCKSCCSAIIFDLII